MIKSKQDGLSMIELLIVMGIVAVLTGIATLAFSTWVIKYDIERQVYVLYSQLLKTRADAMHKNSSHFVVLKENSYSIVADTDPAPFGDGENNLADTTVLPETAFNSPINKGSTVTFDSRGLVPLGQTRTICIYSDVSPDFDCLVISRARIHMGKIARQGSPCNYENCTAK